VEPVEIIQQVVSVLLVLALLAGALWFLNRRSTLRLGWRGRGKRCGIQLEAVERLPLSSQHCLHLIRLADRALLVAVHGPGCTLIESRPWSEIESVEQPSREMAGAVR